MCLSVGTRLCLWPLLLNASVVRESEMLLILDELLGHLDLGGSRSHLPGSLRLEVRGEGDWSSGRKWGGLVRSQSHLGPLSQALPQQVCRWRRGVCPCRLLPESVTAEHRGRAWRGAPGTPNCAKVLGCRTGEGQEIWALTAS